jgi:hypothetical protein
MKLATLLLLGATVSYAVDLDNALNALDEMKRKLADSTNGDILSSFIEMEDGAEEQIAEREMMESAVHKAIQATMAEEGAHVGLAEKKGFFKKLFNCHKCK